MTTNSVSFVATQTGHDMCNADDKGEPKSQPLSSEVSNPTDRALSGPLPNISLHQACQEGELDVVKHILSHRLEDINSLGGRERRTPIMVAALNRQVEVFDYLVSQNCDLLAVDGLSYSVLHLACIGGNVDIVRRLLHSGKFDIDCKTESGWTPVMTAVRFGHDIVFKLLVYNDCNLKAMSNRGSNILHLASKGGHVHLVEYILTENIFSIDCRGYNGRTAVMEAAFCGHIRLFDFLVKKSCNLKMVDKYLYNVLHIGCIGGHLEMVKRILSLGIFDIDSRDHYGRTAVMLAAEIGEKGIFDFLVTKKCNIQTVDVFKNNILHLACLGGHMNMVKYLITLDNVKGMEKVRNTFGRTPCADARK